MRRRGSDNPKREERRSVWNSRDLSWLDRLRRRLGGGREDERQVPALNRDGEPIYVVAKGELLGIRDTRGGIIKIPQPPADRPDLWPDEWWGDQDDDDGWIRVRRVRWR